jgi:hypothetical protein
MALKDIEFCDAQALESMATGLGRGVSRRIMDDACRRIRADFEEMPDLTVTTPQAARFWAMDEQVATAALQHLEERGILRQSRLCFRRVR